MSLTSNGDEAPLPSCLVPFGERRTCRPNASIVHSASSTSSSAVTTGRDRWVNAWLLPVSPAADELADEHPTCPALRDAPSRNGSQKRSPRSAIGERFAPEDWCAAVPGATIFPLLEIRNVDGGQLAGRRTKKHSLKTVRRDRCIFHRAICECAILTSFAIPKAVQSRG